MSVGGGGGGVLLRGCFCFGSICQDKHGLKGHSVLEYLMIQKSQASDLQANKGEDGIHSLEPRWFALDYWVYKKREEMFPVQQLKGCFAGGGGWR